MVDYYLSLAVKKLRYRSYSTAEIRDYLLGLGADSSEIEAVIGRLIELSYLDERRLATEIYESCHRVKPCGSLFWSAKMQARGISNEIIAEIQAENSKEDEYILARELTLQYLRTKGSDISVKKLRGISSLLTRRGFAVETIAKILQELQEESL